LNLSPECKREKRDTRQIIYYRYTGTLLEYLTFLKHTDICYK